MIARESPFGTAEHARAVLNILEDFAAEKGRLQDAQRAVLNILEDSGVEKQRQDEARAYYRAQRESGTAPIPEKSLKTPKK